MPFSEHRRDFGNHPVADIGDDPGLLGDRDKRRGMRMPSRMVPAKQCLGATSRR
jgi:hypothetical protein